MIRGIKFLTKLFNLVKIKVTSMRIYIQASDRCVEVYTTFAL